MRRSRNGTEPEPDQTVWLSQSVWPETPSRQEKVQQVLDWVIDSPEQDTTQQQTAVFRACWVQWSDERLQWSW